MQLAVVPGFVGSHGAHLIIPPKVSALMNTPLPSTTCVMVLTILSESRYRSWPWLLAVGSSLMGGCPSISIGDQAARGVVDVDGQV